MVINIFDAVRRGRRRVESYDPSVHTFLRFAYLRSEANDMLIKIMKRGTRDMISRSNKRRGRLTDVSASRVQMRIFGPNNFRVRRPGNLLRFRV